MAITAAPFALKNLGLDAEPLRQAVASLVPNPGGIVQLGDLTVTQTSTPSLGVTVGAGRAWMPGTNTTNVSGQSYSTQGQYFAINDGPFNVTLATADTANPRIDLIYIGATDTQYGGAANNIQISVVKGVPATSPAVPALPPNSIALAQVTVAQNATSVSNSNIVNVAAPAFIRHVEFTGSTSPTANGLWGPGPLTVDSANSYNYSSWANSPSNDRVQLTPGVYMVFIRYSLNAASSGTSWGAIVNDANTYTYAGADYVSGGSNINMMTPIFIPTTQNVRFTFITGTSGATLSSRVRITKVA